METASPWAKDDIKRIVDMGFIPQYLLQEDCQQNITRAEFVRVAIDFMDYMYEEMLSIAYTIPSEISGLPNINHVKFSDTQSGYVDLACGLGIISGYQDGTFNPNGYITRQEAAVMLQNTYKVYGDTPDFKDRSNFSDIFTDANRVAPWALDSVYTMWSYDIMQGAGKDRFEPLGFYTREQCYITFLRLYDKMPISRAKGNVKPLITYDIAYEWVKSGEGEGLTSDPIFCDIRFEKETEKYTILYINYGNRSHRATSLIIVYKTGIIKKFYSFPLGDTTECKFELDEVENKLYISGPQYESDPYYPFHSYVLDLGTYTFTEIIQN